MHKERPNTKKSGKARKGGRTLSWEAPSAKRRRGHEDGRSATDDSDSGVASSSNSLTGTTSYTGPPLRGRPRGFGRGGSNTYTWQAAWKERESARKASQPERQNRPSPFPLHMKEKKGHKWDRSISCSREASNEGREKRHSGQDSSRGPDLSSVNESSALRVEKAKSPPPPLDQRPVVVEVDIPGSARLYGRSY